MTPEDINNLIKDLPEDKVRAKLLEYGIDLDLFKAHPEFREMGKLGFFQAIEELKNG
jgi:hypothetical protein